MSATTTSNESGGAVDIEPQVPATTASSASRLKPGDIVRVAGESGTGEVIDVAEHMVRVRLIHRFSGAERIAYVPANSVDKLRNAAAARQAIKLCRYSEIKAMKPTSP